jgi:hypothetical protein
MKTSKTNPSGAVPDDVQQAILEDAEDEKEPDKGFFYRNYRFNNPDAPDALAVHVLLRLARFSDITPEEIRKGLKPELRLYYADLWEGETTEGKEKYRVFGFALEGKPKVQVQQGVPDGEICIQLSGLRDIHDSIGLRISPNDDPARLLDPRRDPTDCVPLDLMRMYGADRHAYVQIRSALRIGQGTLGTVHKVSRGG